jgi:predicted dehydrogenase
MTQSSNSLTTRRDFIKTTGTLAAVSALAGVAIPSVHAAGNEEIRIVLVGCGGRGTGAAGNALSVANRGPIKLVAMADAFSDKLNGSYDTLQKQFAAKMDVPQERRFVGFDGYKKAMDCLRPGDIVILTTPLAFRGLHFKYAIDKNLNVFMEKPLTADGPSTRRMLQYAEESEKKNLKVGVGLMSRHSRGMQELHKRIQDGQIGDIILMRAYRMAGPLANCFVPKKPDNMTDVEYQIRNFHAFIWASGGMFNDFYIHHIDHASWMKNAWPVKAQALGGRHFRGDMVDQNLDTYSVEYTYADGSTLLMDGRCIVGCADIYNSAAHGSKGMAVMAANGDCGGPQKIFSSQHPTKNGLKWESKNHSNPYQNEWDDLIDAIHQDKKYNEAKYGAEASNTCNMGRMAAHTGQIITFEDALNHEHEMAPNIGDLQLGPGPLPSDANGKYPVPMPGITTKREYDSIRT